MKKGVIMIQTWKSRMGAPFLLFNLSFFITYLFWGMKVSSLGHSQTSAAQVMIKQVLTITIWHGKHLSFRWQTTQLLPQRAKSTFARPRPGYLCAQAKAHYLQSQQVWQHFLALERSISVHCQI